MCCKFNVRMYRKNNINAIKLVYTSVEIQAAMHGAQIQKPT